MEKLARWQEVTSNELDKYFGLRASESTLKSVFSDRWFCQSVSEACAAVSIVGTTRLVTGDMSKVYTHKGKMSGSMQYFSACKNEPFGVVTSTTSVRVKNDTQQCRLC